MQSRKWPIGVANNPLVINPLVDGSGGSGIFPPPPYDFIIMQTGENIISEDGDFMITE